MKIHNLQEQIVKLFLRLNGYIVTDLIIHSNKKGENKTQIDVIGVRFPFHQQLDREIQCSEYLKIPNKTIDIIIGEVKGGNRIEFNKALYTNKETLEKLIEWLGIFDNGERNKIIKQLMPLFIYDEKNANNTFNQLKVKTKTGYFSIRPVLFAFDKLEPLDGEIRYIYGQLMIQYIWDCLRPKILRKNCSTQYNLNQWGTEFIDIIEYFKDKTKKEVGSVESLYKSLINRKK